MDFQERPGEYSLGHFASAIDHYVQAHCGCPPTGVTINRERDPRGLMAVVYLEDLRQHVFVDELAVRRCVFDLLAETADRLARQLDGARLAASSPERLPR